MHNTIYSRVIRERTYLQVTQESNGFAVFLIEEIPSLHPKEKVLIDFTVYREDAIDLAVGIVTGAASLETLKPLKVLYKRS